MNCTTVQECSGWLPSGIVGSSNCYPQSGGVAAANCQPNPRHFYYKIRNSCTGAEIINEIDVDDQLMKMNRI
jgi:hypothetical protein